jgi:hypothetical protein
MSTTKQRIAAAAKTRKAVDVNTSSETPNTSINTSAATSITVAASDAVKSQARSMLIVTGFMMCTDTSDQS